ncbi:MAG: hypothetical protein ACYDA0_09025 [Candidatus Dormibacteraceae bacterium]
MSVIPLAVLLASCNVCVLAAIAAGRALTGWTRARWLIAEFVMYVLVFWASAHVLDAPAGILIVVTLIVGFLIAVLLVFVEYAVVGLRSRFGADFRSSLWLGRFADPFCVGAPYPPKPAGQSRA